jgi:hypothetical protein
MTLTEVQIQDFVRKGFVRLDGAVPGEVALRCQDQLWPELLSW